MKKVHLPIVFLHLANLMLSVFLTEILSGCHNDNQIGNVYYIDAQNGNDENDGLSQKKAWQSIEKVNSTVFEPGDRILFKAGDKWHGQLRPQGSGAENLPICIDKYGEGELPYISQDTLAGAVVLLKNQDQWEIRNLHLDGGEADMNAIKGGIHVQATDIGRVLKHIVIADCKIQNTLGTIKQYESSAIWVGVPGWNDPNGLTTGFDDVLIDGNQISNTDRNGILVWTTAGHGEHNEFMPDLIPSTNVVISNNQIENVGGDAILVLGSDYPLIENNVVNGCCLKTGDPVYGKGDYNPSSAAIWLHHCVGGVMQYNAVYNCQKQEYNNDGMAYDFDFNCTDNILQYNISCNNAGGFLLIMPTAQNNLVRYNISENDNSHVLFCVGDIAEGNQVYNNTFYLDKGESYIVPNAHFRNNIFMADGEAKMSLEDNTKGIFENNCYAGNWENLPNDEKAILNNPNFLGLPISQPVTKGNLERYCLSINSPCSNKGIEIKGNCDLDISGQSVNIKKPHLGAMQQ